MKCKRTSSNLHRTRVLIMQLDWRPSKIFFPANSLDSQLSYSEEMRIDYECCPGDVLPQTPVKSVSTERTALRKSPASRPVWKLGCERKLGSAGRLLSPRVFLGLEPGTQPQDWSWLPRASLRCGRTKSDHSGRNKGCEGCLSDVQVSPHNSSTLPKIPPTQERSLGNTPSLIGRRSRKAMLLSLAQLVLWQR